MLRLIVGKELREILASSKFLWTFVVASLLILLSFYLGAKNYATLEAQHDASVAQKTCGAWKASRPGSWRGR